MPAYLKRWGVQTCSLFPCGKQATHEVYTTVNELFGRYCKTHAEQKVKELNRG